MLGDGMIIEFCVGEYILNNEFVGVDSYIWILVDGSMMNDFELFFIIELGIYNILLVVEDLGVGCVDILI